MRLLFLRAYRECSIDSSLRSELNAGMNIFLTGASGYIGGAIAEALRKANHDVAALVRP